MYWVSIGQQWLVLGGTESVSGSTNYQVVIDLTGSIEDTKAFIYLCPKEMLGNKG